jgi:hypothetical protein
VAVVRVGVSLAILGILVVWNLGWMVVLLVLFPYTMGVSFP